MSSSRIERSGVLPRARGTADSHRRWFKRVLPRSLFGRSLIIIILPLVLAQLFATWIFYDRHWATVERRLATDVASDIAFALDARDHARSPAEADAVISRVGSATDLRF